MIKSNYDKSKKKLQINDNSKNKKCNKSSKYTCNSLFPTKQFLFHCYQWGNFRNSLYLIAIIIIDISNKLKCSIRFQDEMKILQTGLQDLSYDTSNVLHVVHKELNKKDFKAIFFKH